jgi:F420-dependent oxidoreductase-like protein
MRYSLALHEPTALSTIDAIVAADGLGVSDVWLTSMSAEPMAIFSAAAVRTKQIGMGTAILPTYPRHPMVTAQQASVLSQLAPGRFRLGLGPSHKPLMEGMFGLPFDRPLTHLREYVAVVRQALSEGKVEFSGKIFNIHVPATPKGEVPVLISALQPKSFELAGEISDGALAWICPAAYLAGAAREALEAGARQAGRSVPPLIAHTFLCVDSDEAVVREDARKRLANYPKMPSYAAMFERAGITGMPAVSDEMIDAVVVWGDEGSCRRKLRAFAEEARADEVIASIMVAQGDRAAGLEVAMRVVAALR